MITPVSPVEAIAQKNDLVPDFVFEAFNEMIVKNLKQNGSAQVDQNEVLELIVNKSSGTLSRQDVFEKSFLDVEPHYRKSGWIVTYDRPAYYENYNAYYIFKKA